MQVYSLLCSIPYEGYELLGVFASRNEALRFLEAYRNAENYRQKYDYGVVRSELGQAVDVWEQCEWAM